MELAENFTILVQETYAVEIHRTFSILIFIPYILYSSDTLSLLHLIDTCLHFLCVTVVVKSRLQGIIDAKFGGYAEEVSTNLHRLKICRFNFLQCSHIRIQNALFDGEARHNFEALGKPESLRDVVDQRLRSSNRLCLCLISYFLSLFFGNGVLIILLDCR